MLLPVKGDKGQPTQLIFNQLSAASVDKTAHPRICTYGRQALTGVNYRRRLLTQGRQWYEY